MRRKLRYNLMDSEIQIVDSCLVRPSEETPAKRLWLSPLDVALANRGHTPVVYFYRSADGAAGFFDVTKLKEGLAKALVAFYPFAGRLDTDSNGRCEINCNNNGALFVVARSNDLTVNDFNNLKPSPELRRMFVPRIEPPTIVLAVQVTFLKCGGVALGTAVHHVSADATSAFHFFQTWSAICREGDRAVVEAPFHDRTLLRARSPPVVNPDHLSLIYAGPRFCEPLPGPMSCEYFSISKDQLAALKNLCGGASTFCAVSALVWQCICIARRLAPESQTRVMFAANIRRRPVRPPLPNRYFGNALIFLAAAGTVRDITSEPLCSVAGRISTSIGRADDGFLRSALDYLALDTERVNKPHRATGSIPETDLVMVSWLGMPVYDIDFGWGKPRIMSRAELVRRGYVYLMNGSPEDDEGSCAVRVLACMEAANIKEFQRLLYACFGTICSSGKL